MSNGVLKQKTYLHDTLGSFFRKYSKYDDCYLLV